MFAELYAFVLLWMFTWPAVGFIVAAAIWCEHRDSHGWTVISTIVLSVILWKMFALTSEQVMWGAALYIPIGFMWSFWRWKLHCDKIANEYASGKAQKAMARNVRSDRNGKVDPAEQERAKQELRREIFDRVDPRRHVDKMIYWVMGWPFSLVERALSDLLNFVETLIRTTMQQTYQRISNHVMKRVDKMLDEHIEI